MSFQPVGAILAATGATQPSQSGEPDREARMAAERAKYYAALRTRMAMTDAEDQALQAPRALARAGVPVAALRVLWRPDSTAALEGARAWWAGDKRASPALVLLGWVGVGKTVAAAWCAREWARGYPWNRLPTGSNQAPLVWLAGGHLRELSRFDAGAQQLLSELTRASLVVFDDSGREGDRRTIEALSDALVERVDSRRLTVLTSNLRGVAFRARYGVALADRLRASAVVPRLTGASLRGVRP